MDVTPLVWLITGAVILGLFAFDLFVHLRSPHEPTLRESALWTALYLGVALSFGLVVMGVWGGSRAGEYYAGFVTEWALSVDNLFVFAIIMGSFAVPRAHQQKVLLIGILMALGMRAVFIAVGAAAIDTYSWVFYLFGLFLVYTAVGLLRGARRNGGPRRQNRVVSLVRRLLPTTEHYDGSKMITKLDGKRVVTPLLLALIAIGFTDMFFAVDSIPAIYGLTSEPYIVLTANAFALMGLRQLYFLVGGLLDRLVYLSYGLAAILAFIGVKLLLHALHQNTLGFVNNGQHVAVPQIPTAPSLGVIAAVLAVTTITSLLKTGRVQRDEASVDA